jgi:hypothetical protein
MPDRFWRWLHALAERRIREAHMARHHHDRRCPYCGRWGALYGWWKVRDVDAQHRVMTCRACGQESMWHEDMVPVPVDWATRAPLPAHPMAAIEAESANG